MKNIFSSTFFRFFVPILAVAALGVLVTLFLTASKAKKFLYELKAQESLAVLQNVMQIVEEYQRSLESFNEQAINDRKAALKDMVDIAFSIVSYYHRLSLEGKMTEEEAQKKAIEVLSQMRYGKGDYIWGINEDYVLFIHPDEELKNKNLYNLRDPDGVYVIRELVDQARRMGHHHPVFVFYRWWRYEEGKKSKKLYPKLSVSVYFQPWGWIIGTGVYIHDIDEMVRHRREEALERLRQRLDQLRIGSGYPFVLDQQGTMIYHPIMQGVNLLYDQVKDPATGNLIFLEIMEAARKPWGQNYLEYLWNRPDDPEHYVYPKVAWCAQEPLTGWYIVITAYKDEIEAPARLLSQSLFWPAAFMLGGLAMVLFFLLRRLLEPVKTLVSVCERVERGDLSARAPENIPGEIGYLAGELNRMIAALEAAQEELERRVAERTRDLLQKTRELEEANRRLKELDRVKSAFLSSVSHELRTPLTSILGFAKLISKDFRRFFAPGAEGDRKLEKKARRIAENLDVIVKEGERLTRLINDVLDLTKIESGRLQWNDSRFSLKELLEDVVKSVSGEFAQKPEVELRVELPEELPEIYADRDRLHQVFINLLNNAAKFTEKGYVKLSARVEGGRVLIAVEDTGCGIPPEEVDKVFDKFHQVVHGDTLKDKPKGTGLGLSICKQIIQHYRGRIWVESELGRGSTFYVELPVEGKAEGQPEAGKRGPDEPRPKTEGPVTSPSARRRPLILVTDDDDSVRKLLMEIFSGEGFEVVGATNGREALELARRFRPDLITLDLMMPEMDGKTALQRLKADPELSSIPVLIISVLSERERVGGDAYMEKPIDQENLLKLVHSLLQSKRVSSARPCMIVTDEEDRKDLEDIPIIICSGKVRYCRKEELERLLEEGFEGTILLPAKLQKAVDLERLLENKAVNVVIF